MEDGHRQRQETPLDVQHEPSQSSVSTSLPENLVRNEGGVQPTEPVRSVTVKLSEEVMLSLLEGVCECEAFMASAHGDCLVQLMRLNMRKNRFGHNRVYVISDMSGERAQNEDEDDHDDDFRDMDQSERQKNEVSCCSKTQRARFAIAESKSLEQRESCPAAAHGELSDGEPHFF